MKHYISACLLALLCLSLNACSWMMSSASERLGDSLSAGVLNQQDPELVKTGLPSYLLLIDGLIRRSPDNTALLRSGAELHSAYAGQFIESPERQRIHTALALDDADQYACLENTGTCGLRELHYQQLTTRLDTLDDNAVPALYLLASTWAGWIQARTDDWDAVARLPWVVAMLQRVIALDEGYQNGSAHLYLGVMSSLVPPAMGGRPEQAEAHFRRAIELSQGRNLMAKVLYARYFARLMFDQGLHDRLLQEVLAADPEVEDLTLINSLAQAQAHTLLEQSNDYF